MCQASSEFPKRAYTGLMSNHKGHCPKTIKGGQDSSCTCYRKDGQPKSFHRNYDRFPVELDPNAYGHKEE